MKKYLFCILLFSIIFTFYNCSSESSELYEQAIEKVKEQLKVPSTAKFQDYEDKYVKFQAPENYSKDDPRKFATVEVIYDAQNSFGAYIRGSNLVVFTDIGNNTWRFLEIIDNDE